MAEAGAGRYVCGELVAQVSLATLIMFQIFHYKTIL